MADQITPDDFKAPEGKYRIMREEMSDGKLSVVADFCHVRLALISIRALRLEIPQDVFTMCDETGMSFEIPEDEDHTHVNLTDMPGGELWDREQSEHPDD